MHSSKVSILIGVLACFVQLDAAVAFSNIRKRDNSPLSPRAFPDDFGPGVCPEVPSTLTPGQYQARFDGFNCYCLRPGTQPQIPPCPTDPHGQAGCTESCQPAEYDASPGGGCGFAGSQCYIQCDTGYSNGPGLTTNPCVPNAAGSGGLTRRKKRDSQFRLEKPLDMSKGGSLEAFQQMGKVVCSNSDYIACPISSAPFVLDGLTLNRDNFECVDPRALETCGGCVSDRGIGVNCYEIEGAFGFSCDRGNCVVDSCLPTYSLKVNPMDGGTYCVRK